MKLITPVLFLLSLVVCPILSIGDFGLNAAERPNILWITSEDNSPYLGAYGYEGANTPNLDRLAEAGVLYTNAFANAPVCSVARSTWIFGVPAVTTGTFHMRSGYEVPRERFKTYPEYLREAGYYVTNNFKTDYNTKSIDEQAIWDASSREAHYKNRPEGTPFFAVFNLGSSHESGVFKLKEGEAAKTPADAVEIPPYSVATPETVRDWRHFYDGISWMDSGAGKLIEELEALGEADNTIVVYCSDHGGITKRSKRYLHDSGVRVPLIVAFPEKWQHLAPGAPGTRSDRLVQFIDMPKTWLSLAGLEPPQHMPGRVFLGDGIESAPESVFLFSGRFGEAPDNTRGVTDGRWKYIRNYESDRLQFQMLTYPLNQAGQRSQWRAHAAGVTNAAQAAHYEPKPPEELYDTQQDPHEIHNLADFEPAKLAEMRRLLRTHILAAGDVGFIPEPMMATINWNTLETIYEFAQSPENYPLDAILDMADMASDQGPANIAAFVSALDSKNEIIRYWATVGLRALGDRARPVIDRVRAATTDPSPSVRVAAMTALARMGSREEALQMLLAEAGEAKMGIHNLWALHALKELDAREFVQNLSAQELKGLARNHYSKRVLETLRADGSVSRLPDESIFTD